MVRRDKVNYYLDLAKMVAQRSTCLRRHYGAVIVKNDGGGRIVRISGNVSVSGWRFRGESGMSFVAAFMRRRMPLSARPGIR